MLKKAAIIVAGSAAVILAAPRLRWRTATTTPRSAAPPRRMPTTPSPSPRTASPPRAGRCRPCRPIAIPVNANSRPRSLSCNNIEDVLDLNVTDNVQDNSKNIDKSKTVNRDSFNTTDVLPIPLP